MAKKKYEHTPQYLFKRGYITIEEYNKLSAPKPRKKYDVSKRVGAKRGHYYTYSTYLKELEKVGIRPGAKVPKTRADYHRVFSEQLDTPLKGGQKVTRQQAFEFLIKEVTYSDRQVDVLCDNINNDFITASSYVEEQFTKQELQQLDHTTLGQVIDSLSGLSDYDRELLNVVWVSTNNPNDFFSWRLQYSDVRGNSIIWQRIKNLIDYQDSWEDVYGS